VASSEIAGKEAMQAEAKEMQQAARVAQKSAIAAQKLAKDAEAKATIAHDIAAMQPLSKVLPPCKSFLQSYRKSTSFLQKVLNAQEPMPEEGCAPEAPVRHV